LKLPAEVNGGLSDSFEYSFLISNASLLRIKENGLFYDCWAAKYTFNETIQIQSEVDCNAQLGVICSMVLPVPTVCKQPKPIINNTLAFVSDEPWDVLLDQKQILNFMKAAEQKKRDFKKAFRKMD